LRVVSTGWGESLPAGSQPNDECRIPNDEGMTKRGFSLRHLSIRASFVIRHSCFVILDNVDLPQQLALLIRFQSEI
jgi:hypothetical protein